MFVLRRIQAPHSSRMKNCPRVECRRVSISIGAIYKAAYGILSRRVGSELQWQLKVRTRLQKVGESLMEFCGALRGMADKAFPAWPAEQLQDLQRNQFIQGVLSSSVQLVLMKEEPKTLDVDALKLACNHILPCLHKSHTP